MSRPVPTFLGRVTWLLDAAIVLSGLALVAVMIAQVLMRYVLDGGFLGVEELSVLFGVWFYFLGVARVTRSDEHIRGGIADLIIRTPRGQWRLRLFDMLFVTAVNALFCGYAILYVWRTHQSGRSSTYMGWPMTFWAAAMAVGFLLATVFAFAHLCRVWRSRGTP